MTWIPPDKRAKICKDDCSDCGADGRESAKATGLICIDQMPGEPRKDWADPRAGQKHIN